MYLILSYVQLSACVREELVPTLRCTDCARGRFSSRQRDIRIDYIATLCRGYELYSSLEYNS